MKPELEEKVGRALLVHTIPKQAWSVSSKLPGPDLSYAKRKDMMEVVMHGEAKPHKARLVGRPFGPLKRARQRLSGTFSHLENRTFSVYWRARAPQVLRLLSIQPRDVVLEVGCGNGLWTSYVAPRVGRMVAADIDIDQLRSAQEWRAPRGALMPNSGAHFIQADARKLPFTEEEFSQVFAVDVIEHIDDDLAFLQEAWRVLKPGGTIVLTTLLLDRPSYLRKAVFYDHVREYRKSDLAKLMADAGFQVLEWFSFYHLFQTLATELRMMLPSPSSPVLRLLKAIVLCLLSWPEGIFRLGQPSGIGVKAIKPPGTANGAKQVPLEVAGAAPLNGRRRRTGAVP